ncbi:MAG: copper-binding protein [Balneolales bacterium]
MAFLIGCSGEETQEIEEVYQVKGRYLSTDINGEYISVVHEAVPDVMHSMRMNMRIENASVAEGLETGDVIAFELFRTNAGWYIRNIEVLPPDTELDLAEELRNPGL